MDPRTDAYLATHDLTTGKRRLTTLSEYLLGYVGDNTLRVRALQPGESMIVGVERVENVTCGCVLRTGTDHGCSDCEGDLHTLSCNGCGAHLDGFGLCEDCREGEQIAADYPRASGWL